MITFTFTHVLVCLLGVIGGIVFGAIPGMTATMAVAVFLPLTYAYDIQTVCSCSWVFMSAGFQAVLFLLS